MAKVITGTPPKVEPKIVTLNAYREIMHRQQEIIEDTLKRHNIPIEATLTIKPVEGYDSDQYTWQWWEITL